MKWEFEAEIALRATSSAGSLLNHIVVGSIAEKENYKDIVTEFDFAVGKHINTILSTSSNYPIVNEEFTDSHSNVYKHPYWVVDPIDGTTNFSTGMHLFASSVGLVENNDFLVGAIYAPKTKELYFTYGDQGSYLNGKLIGVKKNINLKQASVVASFANMPGDPKQYEAFGEINDKSRTLLRLGSAALNIAYVCDGRLNGAYGIKAKIWDIGASLALAKHAGATVFYEFIDNITLNYVVGSSNVVSEIKDILSRKELINGH